jgi:hypothetical protein
LPIEPEVYQRILGDPHLFRVELDEVMAEFPELFPAKMAGGYQLHDMLPASKKMPDIRLRRIKIAAGETPGQAEVFTIRPSFVLPFMTGYTNDVEKALFLRQWAVPPYALAFLWAAAGWPGINAFPQIKGVYLNTRRYFFPGQFVR